MLPTFAAAAVRVHTYLTPAYNGTARDPDISSFPTDFRSIQILTTAVFRSVRSISQATFILHSGVTQLQFSKKKKSVKCTLVQALRLCTGRTAHRGSRGIALLFHDHGTRKG